MDPFAPNKAGLVSVKLIKNYASNVAGETAGFLPKIAKALVKEGMAHLPGHPPKGDNLAAKPADASKGDGSEVTSRKFRPQKPAAKPADA